MLLSINNIFGFLYIILKMIEQSFYFTYVFLVTTGTICFIEALRTQDNKVRHVMNIETCISVIAAYFYGQFVKQIEASKSSGTAIDWAAINNTRYVDWLISTPFMLLALCMVLSIENKHSTRFFPFVLILVLDIVMIASGYYGEIGKITKSTGTVVGFAAFILLYVYIWMLYMTDKRTVPSMITFGIFVFFWALYGVVYNFEEEKKIIYYNVLDLIAKAFVGIFFWMYFTGVVKF
jgi:bacteriorhodopsin